MSSKITPVVKKLYYMPKPNIFDRGIPSKLPPAYRKFVDEWSQPRSPVHYQPEPGKWKRDTLTGQVLPVQNVPIPLKFPKEASTGIWGGEGVILGYKKAKRKYQQKTTKWWVPSLHKSAVYSEILDKRLSVVVTKRTINLIIDHNGFDHYILKTPANDLVSLLALKLKKQMLLALFDKTLYPDDPTKREQVYKKYEHYLANFNKEDLEWYALSIGEAVKKFQEMEDSTKPIPLKHQYRAELIEELKSLAMNKELDKVIDSEKEPKTWLSRINIFAKKT